MISFAEQEISSISNFVHCSFFFCVQLIQKGQAEEECES